MMGFVRFTLLVLVVAACGDNRHPAAIVMDVSADPPAYGRAPFPTDAVMDGPHLGLITGLELVTPSEADLVAAHLQALGGWGLRPVIEFFVEGPVDPATIPATTHSINDALGLVDENGGGAFEMDWRYDATRGVIAGTPHLGTQLDENTRYAAFVTTDVRSIDGEPVFGAFSLGELDHDPPARWQTTADSYDKLAANPALAGRLAAIAVFTTQAASDALVNARDAISNLSVAPAPVLAFADPTIVFDTPTRLDALLGHATRDTAGVRSGLEQWGSDNPTGIAHDHVGVVASGTTNIVRFRGDDTGTDGPEDETFLLGAFGVPQVRSIDTIPITIILPKAAAPTTGYPVVIFGHGLGGSRHDMLPFAEPLTAQGYALVAIDMSGFGSRFDLTDLVNNLGANPGFTGDPTLPDGFGDNDAAAYVPFFEDLKNIAAIRDTIRQSAVDFARVAQLVQAAPSLAALAAPYASIPKLDPTRVAYLGESFGTLVGTDLAAIEPSIGLFVLDVPGGGVIDQIVPNSPAIGSMAIPLVQGIYRTTGTFDRFHPLVGMMQAVFDAGDSLTFARHVLRAGLKIDNFAVPPRSVVCIEVVGDQEMPNVATEALARGFELSVLQPDLDPPTGMIELASPAARNSNNETAVMVQYEPATHGNNWSAQHGQLVYEPLSYATPDVQFPKLPAPITIAEPLYETQAQVAEILSTYFAGQPPVVVSTKAPVADFDGDGVPDDVDPYPLDPTK